MFTKQHYVALAKVVGEGFHRIGEERRIDFYDSFYTPLVDMLVTDNPDFNSVQFSYTVATAQGDAESACRSGSCSHD